MKQSSKVRKSRRPGKDTLIVGIDASKREHMAQAMSPSGVSLSSFRFTNDRSGLELLRQRVEAFGAEEGLSQVVVGMESTGSYGYALLRELQALGWRVEWVNPAHTHRLKHLVDNTPEKSDEKDPEVIGTIVELGRTLEVVRLPDLAESLRQLCRHRQGLMVDLNRTTNRMEGVVAQFFPELLRVGTKLETKTMQQLLRHYPAPVDIGAAGLEALVGDVRKWSRGRWGRDKAEALYEAARRSIGVRGGVMGYRRRVAQLLEQLDLQQRQLQQLHQDIVQLLGQDAQAQLMLTVPMLGPISVANLLAEVGDWRAFARPEQILKLAGLNLARCESGQYRGKLRISKCGNPRLRHTLYLAALGMCKKNGLYGPAAAQARKAGKPGTQTVLKMAKKLVYLVHAMIRNNQPFNLSLWHEQARNVA